jgi:hypothetical protein
MRAARQAPPTRRKPPESGRFLLLVDRQVKASFDDRGAAEAEAKRILDQFPHLYVNVEDGEKHDADIRTRT